MKILVSFFIGLALLASGNEIGSLTDMHIVSLICNFMGALLMAYGAKCYADERKKEVIERSGFYREISDAVGRSPAASDYEKIAGQLNEIGAELKQFRDKYDAEVFSADRMQSGIASIIKTSSDTKEQLVKNAGMMTEMLDSLSKDIQSINMALVSAVQADREDTNKLKSAIQESGRAMNAYNSSSLREIEQLKNILGALEYMPDKIIELTDMTVEELAKKLNGYTSDIAKRLEELTWDINERDEKQQQSVKKIQESNESYYKEISNRIIMLTDMTAEELAKKLNGYTSDIAKRLEELTWDINERDEKQRKSVKKMQEYNMEISEDISEKIEKMSEQYIKFEEFADSIIRQMTEMSEKDIEIMSGFLEKVSE